MKFWHTYAQKRGIAYKSIDEVINIMNEARSAAAPADKNKSQLKGKGKSGKSTKVDKDELVVHTPRMWPLDVSFHNAWYHKQNKKRDNLKFTLFAVAEMAHAKTSRNQLLKKSIAAQQVRRDLLALINARMPWNGQTSIQPDGKNAPRPTYCFPDGLDLPQNAIDPPPAPPLVSELNISHRRTTDFKQTNGKIQAIVNRISGLHCAGITRGSKLLNPEVANTVNALVDVNHFYSCFSIFR